MLSEDNAIFQKLQLSQIFGRSVIGHTYESKKDSSLRFAADLEDGSGRDLVWGVTPFGQPSAALVVALHRAGAFGVLDIATSAGAAATEGGGNEAAQSEMARTVASIGAGGTFGVRVGATAAHPAAYELPPAVTTVVIAAGTAIADGDVRAWEGRRVVVEVTSLEEGRLAVDAGARGLIAKGAESGGRVGEVGALVLLQQLAVLGVPLWCQGGIGLHTAAAAIAGGATGVVLDTQLALVKEMRLPKAVSDAIATMDGTETTVVGRHRVFVRPDLPAPPASATETEIRERLGVDLRNDLLPTGQDSAFAGALAKRFHTAGGVVHAVRTAINAQLASARSNDVLGPGSAFAQAFGLRYPIAQGPMTRVSDRPEFAVEVARHGGLPFIALALMAPDAARDLLRETKELADGRTWGVGILGFVPAELRRGQLGAVLAVRPPVALIAGGRPSLARPLEEAGIATFLHVPSPGLLELFVREGAKRFVFEGRECGGHVGPRSSFVLWEQQIAQLLKGDVQGMDVLFAGGVHDARSAAMVAAMAAPLAERGARIGVLMGTAYLFTAEAVATGAIKAPFQEAALACRRTALLETSPGHTTRCAVTNFAHRFDAEREALEAAGLSGPQRWATLDELNLGRLRIAAKGLKRDGDQITAVNEDEQRRDGLYMIGDVATLRDEATTIATLHEEVSVGSGERLAAMPTSAKKGTRPIDVAVIGIACLFPGARDAAEYWANIVAGGSQVREVPAQRWDPAVHCSAEAIGPKGTVSPSRWGGFLEPAPFDPMKYGIPPSSLSAIEPVQLLSLDVAAQALADAGYAEREFDRSRTSVIFGVEGASDLANAYAFRASAPSYFGSMPAALDEVVPAMTEDSFPGVLSNVIAGRIANRLDLGGANFSVDAACAASLAAVNAACQELVMGGSDMVLCGGADLHNGVYDYQLFASVGALSPTGSCKSFDEGADGIALGEGVAVVVLKRLTDATRDGDRIYSVIKGVGASSDGRSLGLTAPRSEGQRAALERAYQQGGVAPETVGLVEAHGTGTVVGDRTELSTLTDFFTAAGSPPGECALGSVKAQIGHTKCAAGMAGLIKASLALHHAVRPPTAHITRPSAAYDPATSPFAFSTTARPWSTPSRRAGVSAFGFGGSNFHVVLDSHDTDTHGLDHWPAELFAFRGTDVENQMAGLAARLDDGRGSRLRDLARHAWVSGTGPIRHAFVATSIEDLRAKLSSPAAASTEAPKVAFLFPGQGSQRPAMLADLFVTFPSLHELLRRAERYEPALFPATSRDPDRSAAQRAAITDTLVAQPTLGLAGLAVAQLLQSVGVRPDAVGGHSFGEIVALSAAGVYSPSDLVELSEKRAQAMTMSSPGDHGAMAAVAGPLAQVKPLLERWPGLVVANDNSPRQVVISGPSTDVAAASEWLSGQGLATRALPVACGFHSPLMADAAAAFAGALAEFDLARPTIPVWSNQIAGLYPDDPEGIARLLASQVDHPVRFREQIEAMYETGVTVFVEAGPGRVLAGLVGQILGNRPHHAIAVDTPGRPGLEQLLDALAQLAIAGVPLTLDPFFEGREIADVGARQARPTGWTIDGHLVRGPDGRPMPGGLRPANEIPALAFDVAVPVPPAVTMNGNGHVSNGAHHAFPPVPAAAGPADIFPNPGRRDGDPVMMEYLRGLSQMVTASHDLMARYLGEGRSPALPVEPAEPVAVVPPATAESPAPPTGDAVLATVVPSATAESPAPPTRDAVLATIVAVVSDRTGYPTELLGPDLDLEADLSIDSIKRIEIVGDLAEKLGVTGGGFDDAAVEHLARLKTLNAMADWITHAPAPLDATPPDQVAPPTRGELLRMVVTVVSDRTGYPKELLGADLDLEADLSIDSIKRIEIVGDLVATLGVTGAGFDDADIEHLAHLKTLSAIVDWITDRDGPLAPPASGPAELPVALPGPPATVWRYLQRVEPAGPPSVVRHRLAGQHFLLTDDTTGIAAALAESLRQHGAQAIVGTLSQVGPVDGVVHLASLSPQAPTTAALFGELSPRLGCGLHSVLFVTGTGGSFGRDGQPASVPGSLPAGAGLRGMAKTLDREYPDLWVRTVDLDPGAVPALAAAQVLAEMQAADSLIEVGYRHGRRLRLRTVTEPPVQNGSTAIALGPGDVVLLTGGGRGITATVAVALASRGCNVELVGRTPLPDEPEGPATAACPDERSLRRLLSGSGTETPAAIDRHCRRIMAEREIRATLALVAQAGGEGRYHALDVRDAPALAALVGDIHRRHGRLDGMVHGAGVIEDRLAADKTVESFDRVYDTKVEGARALLRAALPGTRFVVLFGSVAGAFGNRGQVDYAAANEALEAMAWSHNGGPAGRVVCIHWGPWGGAGMVSPALEREFARQGIGLIGPDEGAACLVRELALGSLSDAAVVLMRAEPPQLTEAFDAPASELQLAVGGAR